MPEPYGHVKTVPAVDTGAVLETLRREFTRLLGDRLHGIVLFGSRARGDARRDSDVDLLLVMNGEFDYGDLLRRTSPIVSQVSLEYDIVVSRTFVRRERFASGQTPFLMNVRREGVTL